jgi:hypothetical protein
MWAMIPMLRSRCSGESCSMAYLVVGRYEAA